MSMIEEMTTDEGRTVLQDISQALQRIGIIDGSGAAPDKVDAQNSVLPNPETSLLSNLTYYMIVSLSTYLKATYPRWNADINRDSRKRNNIFDDNIKPDARVSALLCCLSAFADLDTTGRSVLNTAIHVLERLRDQEISVPIRKYCRSEGKPDEAVLYSGTPFGTSF